MNGYITISEASKKWHVSIRWINQLCMDGRIEGASKLGNTWAIPVDAVRPPDKRIKSGIYKKCNN